jgi:uncharacterized protein (DUF433 family)
MDWSSAMARSNARKVDASAVISRDPDVHSGDVVFAGTRVPVDTLIDYLKNGQSVDDFLEGFPTVERWQVEGFLDLSPAAVDHLRSHGASAA